MYLVQHNSQFQDLTIEELSSMFLKSKFWMLYLESTSLRTAFCSFLKTHNIILTIDNSFMKLLRKAIAKNLEAESFERVGSLHRSAVLNPSESTF